MSNTIYGQPIMLGGGIGLNIAYGTTPPTDTSKLWVPLTKKPDSVEISAESMQSAVDALIAKATSLPNTTYDAATVAINGKVYIFGGSNSDKAILEYDPSTDTIVDKGVTVENLMGASAVAINGKAYIFGGGLSSLPKSNVIQEYDPSTNTITTKSATLATATGRASAVAINGKAYIFGGNITIETETSTIQEYDPSTDTVSVKGAKLTEALRRTAAAVANNKAYIFGGYNNTTDATDIIQEYDPVTDKITVKSATLARPANGPSAVGLNEKIYIFGGENAKIIQEYDPSTDEIVTKTATLVDAMYGSSAVPVDGKAYIFGGRDTSANSYIQEYTVRAYLDTNHLKVFASVYSSEMHQVVTNIVNHKGAQVKLYITSAFLGDDDGYAMAQDAYVYDEANSEWQALDGTSMTTDMLNALAELGVT